MLLLLTRGLLHPHCGEYCPQACQRAGLPTPGSLLPCRLTPQQLRQNLHLTRFPGDLHALSSLRGSVSDTSVLPCPTFKTVFSLLWFSCLHPPSLLKVAYFKGVWLRLWDTKIAAGSPGRWGCLGGGSGNHGSRLSWQLRVPPPSLSARSTLGHRAEEVIGALLCERGLRASLGHLLPPTPPHPSQLGDMAIRIRL